MLFAIAFQQGAIFYRPFPLNLLYKTRIALLDNLVNTHQYPKLASTPGTNQARACASRAAPKPEVTAAPR
jgi:hypothetical protein